jgi:GT2 family glycosyltransferase
VTRSCHHQAGPLTASVLIPSWKRPDRLERCLRSLAAQTRLPDQVVVVWQGDDTPTRDRLELLRPSLPFRLDVLHHPEPGVVPAENCALAQSTGSAVALIDDDAEAPPDWLARHLAHLGDPTIGAVGGPFVNWNPDGTQFPARSSEPVGRLPWHGQPVGNIHDHPAAWRNRPPAFVDHLAGGNMVLRRAAFDRFESALRPYWQLFELEACLQVRARGYRVLFDFGNVIRHYPTNQSFVAGRDGDLRVKVYNAAYNLAFIHAKHTPWPLMPVRLGLQLAVGRVNTPGLLGAVVGSWRFGRPLRELGILARTWAAVAAGWRDGLRRRSGGRPR